MTGADRAADLARQLNEADVRADPGLLGGVVIYATAAQAEQILALLGTGRETVVNFVTEARRPDQEGWTGMHGAGTEESARMGYESFLASKEAKGFSLEYRLVRRTAVIRDEVLETTEQETEE